MAEDAVTLLLDHVKEIMVVHGDVIAGAETEFTLLSKDLSLLKAMVKDVLPKKYNYNLFNELEEKIKVAVYEIEDAIDTLLTAAIVAEPKKSSSICIGCFTVANRSNLAKAVKSTREGKLTPMLIEANALVSSDESIESSIEDLSWDRTKRVAPIRQDRVIGFDDEEATITRYLLEPTKKLDVITIMGIPGQGKTTLALKVYQSEEICFRIPFRIWFSISQVLDIKDVFIQILKYMVPRQDFSGDTYDELARLVRQCLELERFLLVLDDVWSVEMWNEIKEVLPMHNGEGKVIITSREKGDGMHSSSHIPPHQLKFLDPDESWTLC